MVLRARGAKSCTGRASGPRRHHQRKCRNGAVHRAVLWAGRAPGYRGRLVRAPSPPGPTHSHRRRWTALTFEFMTWQAHRSQSTLPGEGSRGGERPATSGERVARVVQCDRRASHTLPSWKDTDHGSSTKGTPIPALPQGRPAPGGEDVAAPDSPPSKDCACGGAQGHHATGSQRGPACALGTDSAEDQEGLGSPLESGRGFGAAGRRGER
jgi:hypothetical protein